MAEDKIGIPINLEADNINIVVPDSVIKKAAEEATSKIEAGVKKKQKPITVEQPVKTKVSDVKVENSDKIEKTIKRIVNKQGKTPSLNYEKLFLGDNQNIDSSIKDKILKRLEKDFSSNKDGINIDSIQTVISNSADGMKVLETITKGFNEQLTRAYTLVSKFDSDTGDLLDTGTLRVTDTTAQQKRKKLAAQKKQAEKKAQKSQRETDSDYLSHVGQIISAKNKKANNDARYNYVSSDEKKQIDVENESLEKNIKLHETRMKRLNVSNEAIQKGEQRLKKSEGERYINSTAAGKTAKLNMETAAYKENENRNKQAEKENQKNQRAVDKDYLDYTKNIEKLITQKRVNEVSIKGKDEYSTKNITAENEALEQKIRLLQEEKNALSASDEVKQKALEQTEKEKKLRKIEVNKAKSIGQNAVDSTAQKEADKTNKKTQNKIDKSYIQSIRDQIKYENQLADAEKNRDKNVGDKKNQYADQVEVLKKLISYEGKYRENLKASDDVVKEQTDKYNKEAEKREIRKNNSSNGAQNEPSENFKNTLLSKFDSKEIDNLSSATGKVESYTAAVQEAKNKYEELVRFVNNNDMSSKDNQTDASKMAKELQSTLKELKSESYDSFNTKGEFLKSYTGNLEEVRSELVKLISSYEGVDKASLKWSANQKSLTYLMEDSSGEIKKYRVNLEKIGNGYNIRSLDLGKQTGFDKLGDLINNGISSAKNGIVGVVDMYASVQDLINYVRNGVSVFKEYDAALTDISYTTEGTKAQIDAIGKSYVQLAKDMSTSVDASMEVASIYANLQTSSEEVMQSVKPTLMLANATGVDASSASDQIQGILEQFDISTENAEHVVDVLENVSSNLKEDFGKAITNVTEGVSAVGQTAADAGFSFEQLAAMIGKVSEKTRDSGSEIGNSLKTMLTRISKASSLTDEVDNETISKAAKSLHEVGVEVYEQDGTFRNFLQILSELREKWDGLSDAQQADKFAWVFGNKYQRIYLIAGNAFRVLHHNNQETRL